MGFIMIIKSYRLVHRSCDGNLAPHSRRKFMQLYTTPLCPFSHRVRVILGEKGIRASHIDVDLRQKPAELVALTPQGTVPTLKVGERALAESAVIAEYLEEAYPEPALLPRDTWLRAEARLWIRFADERLYAHTRGLLYAAPASERPALLARIYENLRFMENKAFGKASRSGKYWLGEQFTLVDATFLPWFEQRAVLERFRGFVWPEDCPRLLRWYACVATRPAIQSASKPEAFYLRAYGALG